MNSAQPPHNASTLAKLSSTYAPAQMPTLMIAQAG
jgi:hypothetical protein